MRYYLKALRNYAVTQGRASRKEFLLFLLFQYIVMFIVGFLEYFIASQQGDVSGMGLWMDIYVLLTLCPTVCVQVRRLHDTGHAGYYCLLLMVPFINFYIIYLLLKRGDDGVNCYGAPPRNGRIDSDYDMRRDEVYDRYVSTPFESERTVNAADNFCRKCGHRIVQGGSFCTKCGEPVKEEASVVYCCKCGKKDSQGSTFCSYCGNRLRPTDSGRT